MENDATRIPSASRSNKRIGRSGEQAVAAALGAMGWKVLTTNYRCVAGELDIVATEPRPTGNTLVFMEVKARRGEAHGKPITAVDERKRQKLVQCAMCYLSEQYQGEVEPAMRFDIAEVFLNKEQIVKIEFHRGAFDATN